MKVKHLWKKSPMVWEDGDATCISAVFTWDLPWVRKYADSLKHRRVRIGGPAVELMPELFFGCHAELGGDYAGVLQRFNPLATRTSLGCPRKCGFCGVPKVAAKRAMDLSGKPIMAYSDWPDLPVIADDNLLYAGLTMEARIAHFDKVCDRLEKHDWCDFNQGTDVRLITEHHAERFARLKRATIRLALDSSEYADAWAVGLERLLKAGVAKSRIRTYAVVAWKDGYTIDEAWKRCEFIEKQGVKPLPMWFHALNALERNKVTPQQRQLGWNDYERRRLMQWFYQHKHAVPSEKQWEEFEDQYPAAMQ